MKKIFLIPFILSVIIILPYTSQSQGILNRIKNKVNQRANNKVDNAIDKGLDEAEGKSKTKEKPAEGQAKDETKNDNADVSKTEPNAGTAAKLVYTSKYDFVQGEKIIAFEDFSSAAIGDFSKTQMVVGDPVFCNGIKNANQ